MYFEDNYISSSSIYNSYVEILIVIYNNNNNNNKLFELMYTFLFRKLPSTLHIKEFTTCIGAYNISSSF